MTGYNGRSYLYASGRYYAETPPFGRLPANARPIATHWRRDRPPWHLWSDLLLDRFQAAQIEPRTRLVARHSNVDPENVDYVIPGNDDAIRSIEVIATSIADSCLKGLGKREEVETGEDGE